MGIWLRVDPNVAKYVNQAEEINVFFTLAYILMAIGIIIMVIGFLGCCGAIRESQCMLGAVSDSICLLYKLCLNLLKGQFIERICFLSLLSKTVSWQTICWPCQEG